MNELPTNISEDVRRLNPGVFGKLLVLPPDTIAIPVKESKYHAVRTGRYHSKKEARYADTLEVRQRAGDISFWLEQVPFILPGDVVHRVDFAEFSRRGNGLYDVEWVEVKGKDLYAGRMKRKQTQAIYGIKIKVV